MSCATQTYNLGVMNVLFGADRYQKHCIFTVKDTASSLNNKYIVMHAPVTNAKHYFWFNTGAGADPAVPNATGHEVTITANASASAVATALQGVIDPLAFCSATVSTNEVEVVYTTYGYAYNARDGFTTNATGFTIQTPVFGSTQVDLGATDGEISFSATPEYLAVPDPRYGAYNVVDLRRGVSDASASFDLKDSSAAMVRKIMNQYGNTFVSDDSDSRVVTGFGIDNLFTSTEDVATKLVLRPSKLALTSDPSEDITFHKALLSLGERTFNPEALLVVPVTVKPYLDLSKKNQVNFVSFGDASKA